MASGLAQVKERRKVPDEILVVLEIFHYIIEVWSWN
jgi:hypothetical protein